MIAELAAIDLEWLVLVTLLRIPRSVLLVEVVDLPMTADLLIGKLEVLV